MSVPRRSLLFVPGSHERAVAKCPTLACDVIIFDLEDGVADAVKDDARARVMAACAEAAFPHQEKLVRINSIDSAFGRDDLAAVLEADLDALMVPKVESPDDIEAVAALLAAHGKPLPIWANVETPRGIVQAAAIAEHPACHALVAGTNDLRAGLGLTHSNDRTPLLYALQALVCAARAYDCLVFDGTYITFGDPEGLRAECEHGKMLGFDGKTLVHPEQIAITNEIFSPSAEEIAQAEAVIAQYQDTLAQQQSVDILDGQMIEALHVRRAQATLALDTALKRRAS